MKIPRLIRRPGKNEVSREMSLYTTAIATVLAWLAAHFLGIDLEPEVALGIALLLVAVAGRVGRRRRVEEDRPLRVAKLR